MRDIEVKSHAVEIKAAEGNIIEAYAATFNGVDSVGDTIRPGAFLKTVAERGPQGSRKIKTLLNHEMTQLPIGTPQHMAEDGHGLLTVTKMSSTQLGRDIYTLALEGALSELSIGYVPINAVKADGSRGYARELTEIKLYEYSILTVPPADERALITAVKSAADVEAIISQLESLISVGLKSGRPLSADNLTRLQNSYKSLHALLQADAEPPSTLPAPEAANEDAEPHPHSDELLPALKSFTLTPANPEMDAVLSEFKRAFAFITPGATP